MLHGNTNTMEGNYIISPTAGYPFTTSQPIGFVQQPPGTMPQYPNGHTIVSPIYYVPSISPQLQQMNGTVCMSNECNNFTNNSITTTVISPPSISSSSTSSSSRVPSPTSDSDINKLPKNTIKSMETEKKHSSCSNNSPIDETSSALLVTDRFAVKLEPNKFIHGVPATKWYTLSDEERDTVIRNQRRVVSYKTALCISYRVKGACSFGENCRFAHSLEELKPPPVRHPKYKTQLCDKFSVTGICPYGSRCNFIHATKSGQIVSDYPKYLACLQKEALSNENYDNFDDDDRKVPFAASMNSVHKKYSLNEKNKLTTNKFFGNEKPQQVINFSKSFGGPMIKTLFEKGKLLKNNRKEKNDNEMINDFKCTLDGCDKRPSTNSSISRVSSRASNSINEEKEERKEINVLEKLFAESHICKNYDEKVVEMAAHINVNDDSDSDDIDGNNYPGSQSYTNGYWKKNNFRSRNSGYYSQSRVPTFLRFDNV